VAGCPGIPGRIKSVWVAGCYRYRWPDHPGIRSQPSNPQTPDSVIAPVRYLGVELEDALAIAEAIEI
jgi:hypothetical protein